jgi:hypothetical protein
MNLKLIKIEINSPIRDGRFEWAMDIRVETGTDRNRKFVESSWKSASHETLIEGIPHALRSLVPELKLKTNETHD